MDEIKKTTSIEEALNGRPGPVTVLALVWKASQDLHKAQNRTIASVNGTYVDSFKDGFKFLNACHGAILISEDNSIRFTDFSPIHWLQPVDIFMAQTLDQGIRERTAAQLFDRCFTILEKLEWHYEERLRLKNDDYKKELSDLRMKFYRTRTFTTYTRL